MGNPAVCLFDLDGLLLDTEPLHGQAWLEATSAYGLTLASDQLLALRGRRRLDCAQQVCHWLAEGGLAVPAVDTLLAVRQPIAEALMRQVPAMPGAQRLVESCAQRGIPMALVTSSSSQAVALKQAPHPWLAAITQRVYGDDPELAAGKPAPDPYLLAARRLAVEVCRCWAFEDSPAGARSAHDAGSRVHVLLPSEGSLAQHIRSLLPAGCELLQSLEQVHLL